MMRDEIKIRLLSDRAIARGLLAGLPFIASAIFLHSEIYYKEWEVFGLMVHEWIVSQSRILSGVFWVIGLLGFLFVTFKIPSQFRLIDRVVCTALTLLMGILSTAVEAVLFLIYI